MLYIIKSILCLSIFLFFYYVFLIKEKANHFKRFYLLGIIVFSLIIPLISFASINKEFIELTAIDKINYKLQDYSTQLIQQPISGEKNIAYTIFWSLYIIGVIIFGIRFGKNIFGLFKKINLNEKIKKTSYTIVLLAEKTAPHSFLNYLFVSKDDFKQNKILAEIFLHEETHIKQKHSLDLICIELVRIIFWLNPLFYLIKKEIKLTHEFLADQNVLKNKYNIVCYQKLLFTYSKGNSKQSLITSSINYSLAKRRIIMMSKPFSRIKIAYRCLFLFPLVYLSLLSFSKSSMASNEVISIFGSSPDKGLKLRVSKETIRVNDVYTTLQDFTITVNETTKNWTEKDFSLYGLDIKVDNDVPNALIQKINVEYHKTKIARASKNGTTDIIYSNGFDELPFTKNKMLQYLVKRGAKFYYKDEPILHKNAFQLLKSKKVKAKILGNITPKELPKIILENL